MNSGAIKRRLNNFTVLIFLLNYNYIGGIMNNFRKRLLAALLSFVMVFLSMSELFTAYAGPPGIVNDPDIMAEVTYDRNVVNSRGNSDFYVGEEVSFYANITISSITRSIPGAYGVLYIPRKYSRT